MRLALALAALALLGAAPADDDSFGPARRVTLQGYDGDAMEPFVSEDGRLLIFNNRNEPPEKTDLFWAERVDAATFAFRGPIAGANSDALDGVASMDGAGRLYFVSIRGYATSLSTVYRAWFAAGAARGVELAPGVSPMKSGMVDFDAEISADGAWLYFAEGDFRGPGPKPKSARVLIAARDGDGFRRLGEGPLAAVNGRGLTYAPAISADGLELFVTKVAAIRPGVVPRIWRAVRASADQPFGAPRRLAAAQGFVEAASLTGDGGRLYFHRLEGGRFVLYMAERRRGAATAGGRRGLSISEGG